MEKDDEHFERIIIKLERKRTWRFTVDTQFAALVHNGIRARLFLDDSRRHQNVEEADLTDHRLSAAKEGRWLNFEMSYISLILNVWTNNMNRSSFRLTWSGTCMPLDPTPSRPWCAGSSSWPSSAICVFDYLSRSPGCAGWVGCLFRHLIATMPPANGKGMSSIECFVGANWNEWLLIFMLDFFSKKVG